MSKRSRASVGKQSQKKKPKYEDQVSSMHPKSAITARPDRIWSTRRTAAPGSFSQDLVFASSSLQFTLSSLNSAAEYVNLFDFYRIDKVTVHFIPRINESVPTAALSDANLFIYIDYDDSVAPVSNTTMYQQDNLIISEFNKRKSITFVPRILYDASSPTGASSVSAKPQWIDCAQQDVRHFGIKFGAQAIPPGGNTQRWDIYVDYYLSFKCAR